MERYIRQTCLTEVAIAGQKQLANANILCIGAGGLGSAILPILVGAGIGKLSIMDYDVVALHNLHRQTIYKEADVDKNKAIQAKHHLSGLNSEVQITAYDSKLDYDNGEELFMAHDLIIDACDNFDAKFCINDLAKKTKKSYVYGSVRRFEGQCALFNPSAGYGIESFVSRPTETQKAQEYNHGVLPSMVGWMGSMTAQLVLGYCLQGSLMPKLGQLIVVDGKAFQLQKLQLPIIP